MPLTVIVRSAGGSETRLTFDGTQRIVLGRSTGCDVRLPDASVSARHATLRAEGAGFALIDEGSSNGTFVGEVRIAPRTSRVVRSGDRARLGRVWIELRLEQAPVTRDLALATRDLALAFVAEALDAIGADPTLHVIVVEGPDQGAKLALTTEDRPYVAGRALECDLPLADEDTSRQHVAIVRRGTTAFVRDLGAKNGAWLGESRVPREHEVPWKTTQMIRVGRTVLALREPVSEALSRIESAPDEPVGQDEVHDAPAAPPSAAPDVVDPPASAAPVAVVPSQAAKPRRKAGWGPFDLAVMAVAVGVLALSIAGLVWLLRG